MKRTLLILAIISSLFLAGCGFEKQFKGKVVDSKTMEPIQGVVALATWSKSMPTPAGSVSRYHDAYETTTDKNGLFSIPGKGLSLGFRNPMVIILFKSGYKWTTTGNDKGNNFTESGKILIKLQRLTLEQRKNHRLPPDPPDESTYDMTKLYLLEINKERLSIGLKPRRSWKGGKIPQEKIEKTS